VTELGPYAGVVYVEERQLFYIVSRFDGSGERHEFDVVLPSASTKSRIVHWKITKIDETVVHGAGLLSPTKETVRALPRHTVYFGERGRVPVKFLPD
jgi:hypothetical protein